VFNGSAITAPDYSSGSQGPLWDDERLGAERRPDPGRLCLGAASRSRDSECLVMSYAGVTYETTA
jgi:hypothetical protein